MTIAPPRPGPAWACALLDAFRAEGLTLFPYVPDNVLRPLLGALEADPAVQAFPVAREEEAVGLVAGAALAGRRGAALMQTSGFATLPNALASLACAFQIPVVMVVSERGALGEFNPGQAIVCRTLRPILDSMGITHHTLARLDEAGFVASRALGQAFATRWPVCLILSPLLTARTP